MRSVVGVLVAAAVGIHCSAAGEPVATSEPPVTEPAETAADHASPASGASAPEVQEPALAPVADLSSLVGKGAAPQVTSKAVDATGATYATGTFIGEVALGDTLIKSRGERDVFVIKLGPAGGLEWVRAVGSLASESAPRVTLEEGQRVVILGMTKGEMDCGTGPLNTWSSSMFFVCIFGGSDGVTLNGGAFPTGNP